MSKKPIRCDACGEEPGAYMVCGSGPNLSSNEKNLLCFRCYPWTGMTPAQKWEKVDDYVIEYESESEPEPEQGRLFEE